MANTLTALQPVLFSTAQRVSAEPFGVIDAISANFNDQGVAKGDLVKVPVAPTRAASDFTPGNIAATGADATAEDVEVQITKSRKVSWHLTGEQMRSLENGGDNAMEMASQLVAQGMRTLRNEAEADAAIAVKQGASRAFGTAGTNPFGSNMDIMADLRKMLRDNGAPMSDAQMCFDTTSEAALLKLGIVIEADKAGTAEERRSGNLQRQFGFVPRQSAGITSHTKGAGTGYDINNGSGYSAGASTITLDGGTINTTGIVAGDVVTFAGDTNKYVVNQGLVATGGDIIIGKPGLLAAGADATEMTIGNSYTPILAFEREAVVGVMRPPIMPANPTQTAVLISDAMGMTYLMLDIAQYGQRTWELHLAWGFKAVQPEHIVLGLS